MSRATQTDLCNVTLQAVVKKPKNNQKFKYNGIQKCQKLFQVPGAEAK